MVPAFLNETPTRVYPANRGPSIFLDKSRTAKGLCLQAGVTRVRFIFNNVLLNSGHQLIFIVGFHYSFTKRFSGFKLKTMKW